MSVSETYVGTGTESVVPLEPVSRTYHCGIGTDPPILNMTFMYFTTPLLVIQLSVPLVLK